MNLVVPYANLHPVVPRVLSSYGFTPRYVDLNGDDHSYWRLLKEIWEKGETVTIVEHDILPWPSAIEEMLACPAIWCGYSYDQRGIGLYHSFGCVKFTSELMKQTRHIWDDVEDRHWSKLDTQFEWKTFQLGIRPHQHRPAVIHLHSY